MLQTIPALDTVNHVPLLLLLSSPSPETCRTHLSGPWTTPHCLPGLSGSSPKWQRGWMQQWCKLTTSATQPGAVWCSSEAVSWSVTLSSSTQCSSESNSCGPHLMHTLCWLQSYGSAVGEMRAPASQLLCAYG